MGPDGESRPGRPGIPQPLPPDRPAEAAERIAHRQKGPREKRREASRAPPFSEPGAWWPDYSGKIGVLIAGGPSVGRVELGPTRAPEVVCIAINNAYKICPWAGVLYACDGAWWRHHDGAREFRGLKVTQDRGVPSRYPDVKRVRPTPGVQEIIFGPKGRIGWGGNGGFHALNLAVQWGLRKIILVGYDMTLQNGIHWHGRHGGALNNPRQASIDRWRGILDAQAPRLAEHGVEVVIGSPGSSLSAYRKLDLGVAIDEFHRSLV